MECVPAAKESFEKFIKSFFFGTQSDLYFRSLTDLPVKDAAPFPVDLFNGIVDTPDGNELESIRYRLLHGRIQGDRGLRNFDYDDSPLTPFAKSASSLKSSLITSGSQHYSS